MLKVYLLTGELVLEVAAWTHSTCWHEMVSRKVMLRVDFDLFLQEPSRAAEHSGVLDCIISSNI